MWHAVVPESVAVCPATGTNCQLYAVDESVSLRTPNTPLIRTWLFGQKTVLGESNPPPPVPTMISRMPFVGSRFPDGLVWAKRS